MKGFLADCRLYCIVAGDVLKLPGGTQPPGAPVMDTSMYQKFLKFYSLLFILPLLALGSLALLPADGFGEAGSESAFYPTWKLLNRQEKQHFIAGYLHGWQAAAQVTEITAAFVKQNPDKATESLEHLQGVYNMSDISADALVPLVDDFYSTPSNHQASLSKAITSARQTLR